MNGLKPGAVQHPAKGPDKTRILTPVNLAVFPYWNYSKLHNCAQTAIHTTFIAGVNMLRTNTTHVGNHLWSQMAHTRIQSNARVFVRCLLGGEGKSLTCIWELRINLKQEGQDLNYSTTVLKLRYPPLQFLRYSRLLSKLNSNSLNSDSTYSQGSCAKDDFMYLKEYIEYSAISDWEI